MFLNRVKSPKIILRIGLLLLIVANIVKYMIPHSGWVSQRIADPLVGFLYGLCIGCMLLGIWKMRRSRPTPCP